MRIGTRSLAIAAGLALAASLTAQDAKKASDEKAMMEAMQKASTPGEVHKKLEPFVGTFDARLQMWTDPSKPPETSTGTMTNTWVMGNRFVQQSFEGTFMGQPFNGMGYVGYDNVTKKIQSVWMDSMSTGMMWMTGTADAAGKAVTTKGMMSDPMRGKAVSVEDRIAIADNDHHTFEMWGKGPDGKPMKYMEIQYTRKK
jgi:hypothetical protein